MTDVWLRRCFLEATRLLLLAGSVASLLVTVLRERDGAEPEVEVLADRSVLSALGRVLTLDPDDLGTRESHPYALPGGLWTLRIGLVLLALGLVVLAVATVSDRARHRGRAGRLTSATAAAAVVAGAALAWLGTAWLPDDDLAVGLTASVLLPVATATWAAFGLRWSARLDD